MIMKLDLLRNKTSLVASMCGLFMAQGVNLLLLFDLFYLSKHMRKKRRPHPIGIALTSNLDAQNILSTIRKAVNGIRQDVSLVKNTLNYLPGDHEVTSNINTVEDALRKAITYEQEASEIVNQVSDGNFTKKDAANAVQKLRDILQAILQEKNRSRLVKVETEASCAQRLFTTIKEAFNEIQQDANLVSDILRDIPDDNEVKMNLISVDHALKEAIVSEREASSTVDQVLDGGLTNTATVNALQKLGSILQAILQEKERARLAKVQTEEMVAFEKELAIVTEGDAILQRLGRNHFRNAQMRILSDDRQILRNDAEQILSATRSAVRDLKAAPRPWLTE